MTSLNEFYGFQHTPFAKSIAARDVFASRGHSEIQGRLAYALQNHLPALITGDVGTGKSTAVRVFAQSLDDNLYTTVYLSNPQLRVTALYHEILLGLQIEPAFNFMRLLAQLRATLRDLGRKGRFALLIVDEAHLLPPELFDQLRFLLNDEMDSASLLTLVLLGQPDLAHRLRFAPYEALDQRIAVRFHLRPFDLEETAGYVKHHLRVAGFQGQLFSDSFIAAVYDHTKGVARKINNLCRNALLLGVTEDKRILDETDLKRVLLDLEGRLG
jgi:type II secretory pathway predicted ATPase ExeA